jgi:hypothetical protein
LLGPPIDELGTLLTDFKKKWIDLNHLLTEDPSQQRKQTSIDVNEEKGNLLIPAKTLKK